MAPSLLSQRDFLPDLESVHPNVRQAIEFDFDMATKHRNIRIVLGVLGSAEGQDVDGPTLLAALSLPYHFALGRLMDQLLRLTEVFEDELGFRVLQTRFARGASCSTFRLVVTRPAREPRKRRLFSVPDSTTLPLTEQIFKTASSLVGYPLRRDVPEQKEVESLFTNSRVLRLETVEGPYLETLVDHARRNLAVRIELVKGRLDISSEDGRLKSNVQDKLQLHPLESGFFPMSVERYYHTVFFLDPQARERALIEKHEDSNGENTHLDRVLSFDQETLERRLRNVPMERLGLKERRVLRLVAGRQASGNLITVNELSLQFRMSPACYGDLRKSLKRDRYELGFYLRARGDNKVQCVLTDMDYLKGV